MIEYSGENPVAPELSQALTLNTCAPVFAVTLTDKVLLLIIGPYWTPSSHRIMPSIVGPGTEGCDLAVTVKSGITFAPLAGEITVITSSEVPSALADFPLKLRILRTIQRTIVLTETTEFGTTWDRCCCNATPSILLGGI